MPALGSCKCKLLGLDRVARADRPVEYEAAGATNTTRLAARAQNEPDDWWQRAPGSRKPKESSRAVEPHAGAGLLQAAPSATSAAAPDD